MPKGADKSIPQINRFDWKKVKDWEFPYKGYTLSNPNYIKHKTKLFNYSIQLMETERNMKMMNKLIPMLDSYKSKLILYNYDSLLFDFCMDDKLDFLKMIKIEIEENDKFPTRVSWGTDYKNMKDITEKFSD